MATKLPYVLPFEDGSVVAAILLKAQGLPEAEQIATKTELQQATAYLATLDNATMAPQSAAVKRETDNLQAQIDNIVRAPESGGDVGAEVYQARVDGSGKEFITLKARLDYHDNLRKELFDDITIIDSTFIDYRNGKAVSLSYYCATDFIPTAYPIVVRTHVSDDFSGIAFYDENKGFISGYNPYSDNETEVILAPPVNAAYVRISCSTTYKNSFICRYDKALDTIEDKITELGSVIQATDAKVDDLSKIDYEVVESSFINKDSGARTTGLSVYFSTEYIPIIGDIIVRTHVSDDYSGICFYTKDKGFISGYNPYSDNDIEVTLQPPEGAAYVRISCFTSYADNFVCKYPDAISPIYGRLGALTTEVEEISEQVEKSMLQTMRLLNLHIFNTLMDAL